MKINTRRWLPQGLRSRMMLPAVVFILIFSLFFIVLNNYYTSKLLDERLEREAVRISRMLYESRFILNPAYLSRLGKVIEGRIAVFDHSGKILAASFDPLSDDFLSFVDPMEVRADLAKDSLNQVVMRIDKKNRSFLLVSKKIFFFETDNSIMMAILTPLDDLDEAKSQAALRTVFSGIFALVTAFFFANAVLKKITSSVKNILHITGKIASGDFSHKAYPSEISELNTIAVSVNQMCDRLVDYEKKLVDSTQLLSANKIAAAMAHEIKNPLSSMKMLAQIIQKRFKHDKEGTEMTGAFIKEINRIDRLVSDLGSLAGPGRVSFSLVRPDLPIEEVISLLKPKLDHLKICLKWHMETGIPEVFMDKDKIKQVLWNLMMNGAESMSLGGTLELSLKTCEQAAGFIEYVVKDSGEGITKNNIQAIFTPFFTTKKEGIGIGLHISQEIAHAHGGSISITSTGQGTEASLFLPCNGKSGPDHRFSK
ncbi:MAG: ATP-binding protein [Desulfobacterium sp.]|nr:ATP-binding protein [Desulfobacterium sp.]